MSSLIVYGARCVWWDSIDKTANTKSDRGGLPICPHCGSPLFQQEETEWWKGVARYEAEGHPGYRAFVEWWRGQCFPTLEAAQAAYDAERPTPTRSEP